MTLRVAAKDMLHVAFHSPELPESGSSNGIVTYVGIMRDALRSIGHRVTVVTNRHIEYADGRVANLPEPNAFARRIRVLLERRFDGDGSHAEVRRQVIAAFSAARNAGAQVFEIEETFGFARRLAGRGVAIVTRLHGPHAFLRDWYEPPRERAAGDLRVAAELAGMTGADAVTAPTRNLLDAVAERYDVKFPLARAIPNPIVISSATGIRSLAATASAQILCVGRFDALKGADVALKAFELALKRKPGLRLVFAGPDRGLLRADGSSASFAEFAEQELSASARARIEFLGEQPPPRLDKLREASAFALVTSRFETFSYTIAEAMAAGLPVLASDTFGAREMIRDRVDGRLVSCGSVTQTADAMVDMISDPKRLLEMGSAALTRVSDWLNPERVARQTVELYQQAISRSQRGQTHVATAMSS